MLIALEIFFICLLVLVNGFLAMSEMALVSARKARLRELADAGNRGAHTALELMGHTDFLSTIQVGITLIGILAGAFSGLTLSVWIKEQLIMWVPQISLYAEAISLGVVVVSITFFSIVFGELIPKQFALSHSETLATRIAPIIKSLTLFMRPVVRVLDFTTRGFLRLLGIESLKEKPFTESEFRILIEQGTEAGVFDKTEEVAMKRILSFWDLHVDDIMTPRFKVIGIELGSKQEDILRTVSLAPHIYYPAYEGELDNPVGVLSTKLLTSELASKKSFDIRQCLVEPLIVPKTMMSGKLLERFRESGKRVALVVDEHGGFAGVVSVMDVLEAIIGYMPDGGETEAAMYLKQLDGTWLLDGMLPIRELHESIEIPFLSMVDDEVHTVGGFIMARTGHIPKKGDIVVESDWKFRVSRMDGNRVDKVVLTKMAPFASMESFEH